MVDGTAAEAAAALQAVVRAVGGMPEELQYGRHGHWRLSLQTQPRYSGGAGGHSQAAGSAATAAAPAAVMLAEVTAQQVLERAAARMWDTAEAEAAAAMARAEAAEAAYVAENSWHRREELARMYILLRGPFVWQRTCGPDGAASGGGAARLKEWLESLVARSPPPATAATAAAAAVAPGSPAGTAAAAEAPGEVKVRRCSFAACGSGSAVAVVWCDDPIAALQLYRAAAAAAAGEAPGCLQVSVCKEGADEDWTPVIHAVRTPTVLFRLQIPTVGVGAPARRLGVLLCPAACRSARDSAQLPPTSPPTGLSAVSQPPHPRQQHPTSNC